MQQILKPRLSPESRFEVEGPWNWNDPVHEKITLCALYRQRSVLGLDADDFPNYAFSSVWDDEGINEYLRGVYWNDDPEVLLFDADKDNNADFSTGYYWRDQFNAAEEAEESDSIDMTNMTGRSHFWDMQFLHAMANEVDESAAKTRYRALMWAEFMYKVAIGQSVSSSSTTLSTPSGVANTLLSSVMVPLTSSDYSDTITEKIKDYFTTSSKPKSSDTIKYMLLRDDTYEDVKIDRRAIGSVLHLIQDSFARGHVRRVLLNPEDLTSSTSTSMTFKSGKYGRFGDIVTFHCYEGQDPDEHSDFDEDTTGGNMKPKSVTSFNKIVGARDAISACEKLLAYYAEKTLWQNGPQALLMAIFKLDSSATTSDTNVNRAAIAPPSNTGASFDATTKADASWHLRIPSTTSSGTYSDGDAYKVDETAPWKEPSGGAHWISVNTSRQAGNNVNTIYRVKLTLPENVVPNTVRVDGSLAADNYVVAIRVNGLNVVKPIVSAPSNKKEYEQLWHFSLRSEMFSCGENNIDFEVHNKDGVAGLLVEFSSVDGVLQG